MEKVARSWKGFGLLVYVLRFPF